MVVNGRRWPVLVLAAVGLAVGLTGCGSPEAAAPSSQTPEAAIAMMPSANPFLSALTFTNGLGTAQVDVTATTTVGDRSLTRTIDGTASLDPRGYGIVSWSSSGAGGEASVDEIASDKFVFFRPADSTGLWTQEPSGVRTQASRMISPLTGLGDLTDIVDAGQVELDGTQTRRYTGLLAVTPDRLEALGLTEADLTSVGDAWEGADLDVTVWIDGRNRVVRVDRAFDIVGQTGVPVSASTSTLLSDFAGPLDLTGPPSQSVTALPSNATAS
jgi:hypothetical protein